MTHIQRIALGVERESKSSLLRQKDNRNHEEQCAWLEARVEALQQYIRVLEDRLAVQREVR